MQSTAERPSDRDGACPARISTIDPDDLTASELERLSELTIWGNSDLTRLLVDIREGQAQGVLITLAKVDSRIVGWAAVDRYKHYVLMNCYVDEAYREQGIGTALVQALVPAYEELYQVQPYVDANAMRFYVRAVPLLFNLPKAKKAT